MAALDDAINRRLKQQFENLSLIERRNLDPSKGVDPRFLETAATMADADLQRRVHLRKLQSELAEGF